MEHFVRITVDDANPLAIVHLEGSLAQLEVYKFNARLERLIVNGVRFMVFDLEKLFMIDSNGIGGLLHIRSELQEWGGALVMYGPMKPNVNSALRTSKLGRIIPIVDSSTEAQRLLRDEYGYQPHDSVEQAATDKLLSTMHQILDKLSGIEGRLDLIESNKSQWDLEAK